MKVVLASLTVLLLTAVNSSAMEWIIVPGAQAGGDMICLDRDNVTKEKGIVTAWLKRFKEEGNYSKTLIEVDCSKQKTRLVKALEFDKVTNITTTVDFEPLWETSAPETPARAAAQMICKKGKGINPALVNIKQKP